MKRSLRAKKPPLAAVAEAVTETAQSGWPAKRKPGSGPIVGLVLGSGVRAAGHISG